MNVKDEIVNLLGKHAEGLTISDIADFIGMHRHSVTKYIYELTGEGKVVQRSVGAAKLCYLSKYLNKRRAKKGQTRASLLLICILIAYSTLGIALNVTNQTNQTPDINANSSIDIPDFDLTDIYIDNISVSKILNATTTNQTLINITGDNFSNSIENMTLPVNATSTTTTTSTTTSSIATSTASTITTALTSINTTVPTTMSTIASTITNTTTTSSTTITTTTIEKEANKTAASVDFNQTLEEANQTNETTEEVNKTLEEINGTLASITEENQMLENKTKEAELIVSISPPEQGIIEIGKPVSWKQKIGVSNPSNRVFLFNLSREINIPKDAFNLSILLNNETYSNLIPELEPNQTLVFTISYQTAPVEIYIDEKEVVKLKDLIPRDAFSIKSGLGLDEIVKTRKEVSVFHDSSMHYNNISVPIQTNATKVVVDGAEKEPINNTVTLTIPMLSNRTIILEESNDIEILEIAQGRAVIENPVTWNMTVRINGSEYEIEYKTPGPYKIEETKEARKRIAIISDSTVHYNNVFAYTELDTKYRPRLYHIINGTRVDVTNSPEYDVNYIDTNKDGTYERLEWTIPMLSVQEFEIDLTILNVHSHPQAGDNWAVSFETKGTANLTITPDDQATVDDLDFVSLKCGEEERTPQILENDVISYSNWSCEGVGKVIHLVNVARKHVLKFQFGDKIGYAYNSPGCSGTASYETPEDATAGSEWSPTYAAPNARDGLTTTYWISSGAPPDWIYFDLGSIKCIDGVKLSVHSSYSPETMDIAVSDDTVSWTDVKTGWQETSEDGWDSTTFTETSGRYIRLNVTASQSSYALITEFNASTRTYSANDAPNVTMNSTGYNTTDTTPDVNFTATDNANATFSCTLYFNDTAYGTNSSVQNNTLTNMEANDTLSEGSYDVYVNCTDTAATPLTGQSSSITINITNALPTITINSPTNTTYGTTTVTLNFSVSDDTNNTNMSCWKDVGSGWVSVGTIANGSSYQNTTETASEGLNTWKARCFDGTSNGTSTVYFSVDITGPEITIQSPSNITYERAVALGVDFNVTLNEDGDWCGFELDGGSNVTMDNTSSTAFNYTNSSMDDGSHYVKFWCNDTLGNMNYSTTRYFTTPNYYQDSFNDELGIESALSFNYSINTTAGDVKINLTTETTTAYPYFSQTGGCVGVNKDDVGGASSCRRAGYVSDDADPGKMWGDDDHWTLSDDNRLGAGYFNTSSVPSNTQIEPGSYMRWRIQAIENFDPGSDSVTFYIIDSSEDVDWDSDGPENAQVNAWTVNLTLGTSTDGTAGNWVQFDLTQAQRDALETHLANGGVTYKIKCTTCSCTGLPPICEQISYDTGFSTSTYDPEYFINYSIYLSSANLTSVAITPSSLISWDKFCGNDTSSVGEGTNITYALLNATDNSTISGYESMGTGCTDISGLSAGYSSIILFANLTTTNTSNTPTLHSWNVSWSAAVGDTTAPVITINSPTNKTYGTTSITFNFSVTDETNSTNMSCWKDVGSGFVSVGTIANGSSYQNSETASSGSNTWKARCFDGVQNGTSEVNFTVDTTAPTVTVAAPANASYGDTNVTLTFTAWDQNNVSVCKYELNGAANQTIVGCGNTTFTAASGGNTIEVWANDTFGNWGSSSVLFTVDTAGPTVTVTAPANASYGNTNVTLEFTATDANNISACRYELNDGSNVTIDNCDNTTFTATEGSNSIKLWANDTFDNWGVSSTVYFSVDTAGPTVSVSAPTNTTYNSTNVTLTYTAWDVNNVSFCRYEFNDTNTTIDNCDNTTFLADEGSNYVKVWANDTFNNWDSAMVNFTVDTTKPTISTVTDSPDPVGYGFNVTINATVTDAGVDKVLVGITPPGGSESNYTMSGSGTYQYNFSNTWTWGKYNYTIYANDSAGNTNSSSVYSFNVSASARMTVATKKDNYYRNEEVNLTDPPSNKESYEIEEESKLIDEKNYLIIDSSNNFDPDVKNPQKSLYEKIYSEIISTSIKKVEQSDNTINRDEKIINGIKRIKISSLSAEHIRNVSTYTILPELSFKPKLYHLIDGKRVDVTNDPKYNVKYIDTDNDGKYDKLEWTVPELSVQEFEVDLTILNPYTYLRDNENWTVAFNTTGKADLIISSTNAGWQEFLKDSSNTFDEMRLLDIKCGDISLKQSLQLIDESGTYYNYSQLTEQDSIRINRLFIPDYECNETGYLTNYMLKAGYATLQFTFGNQVAYAYDPSASVIAQSSDVYATFYNGRKLARAPNGDLYIAWNTVTGIRWHIYVNKSTDNGITWTSLGSPSSTMIDYHNWDPSLAVDSNGNVFVAWHNADTPQIIYISNYTTSWSTPINITDGITANQAFVSIAIDSNDVVHATWYGYSWGYWNVRYANSSSNWEKVEITSSNSIDNEYPVIAIDGNNIVHIAWGTDTGSNYGGNISYANSTDWSDIVNIVDVGATYQQRYPSILTDTNNIVHLAWEGETSAYNLYHIRYGNSTDWSAITDIDTVIGGVPSIAMNSTGNLYILWHNSTGTNILYSKYTGSWSKPATLTGSGVNRYPTTAWARHPSTVIFDKIYYAWTANASAPYNITFNTVPDQTGPTVTLIAPANTTYSSTNVTLTYTAWDANGISSCKYELNGANSSAIPNCINTTFTATEGSNSVKAWANDTFDNWGVSSTIYFTVDTTGPTISITAPTNTTYSSTNVTLTYTAWDENNVSQCKYELSGAANVSLPGCWNSSFTANSGSNTVKVYANDTFNNWGVSSTIYFTVSQAPTITKPVTYDSSLRATTDFTQGNTVTIRVNATDPDGASDISKVNITIFYPNSSIAVNNASMTNITAITNGYVYEYNYSIPYGDPYKEVWNVTIYATDSASSVDWDSTLFYVDKSEIVNNGTTDFYAYLLMSVQFSNSGTWTDVKVVVNDTSPRRINSSDTIALDTIWNNNGGWNVSNNATGIYRIYVALLDNVGNVLINNDSSYMNATYSFNVTGNNAPTITINSPTNKTYGTTSVTLNFSVTDDTNNTNMSCWKDVGSGWVSVGTIANGSSYQNSETASSGSNTWKARCFDGVQNGTAEVNFTVDTIRPSVTINLPLNATTNDNTPTFNVTFGETVASSNYSVDGGAWNSMGSVNSYQTDLSALGDGSHYVRVNASDSSGNYNDTETKYFSIDTAGPTVAMQSPTNTTYGSTNVTLTYTAWDAGGISSCKYELNGVNSSAIANCINTTFTAVEGSNYVKVWANDTVGNWNSSSLVYFTVDITGPTVSISAPVNTTYNSTNVTLTYTAWDINNVSSCKYELNGVNSSAIPNCINTTFTAIEGSNRVKVWANDTFNNNASSSLVYFSIDVTYPTVAMTAPTNTTYGSTNVTLTYTAWDSGGISSCKYELNGANSSAIPNCINTTFTAVEGSNHVKVWANDTVGNWNSSSLVYFSVDVTYPIVTMTAPTNATYGSTNVTLTYTAWDAGDISSCKYELNGANSSAIVNCINTTFTAIEGSNHVKVWANDTANLWNSSSLVYFTVDTTGPTVTIDIPANTTYGSTNVSLNYTVSDPSNASQCKYELNDGSNVTLASCQNTTFAGNEGSNHVKVWANDTLDNWGVSSVVYFTVDRVWNTDAECNITGTAEYNTTTIYALCDVNIRSGGVLNFKNVTFYMNMTSAYQYTFTVEAGGTLNTNESTWFRSNSSSYYFYSYGNTTLDDTTFSNIWYSYFENSSINKFINFTTGISYVVLKGTSQNTLEDSFTYYTQFWSDQANHNVTVDGMRENEYFTKEDLVTSTSGFRVNVTNSKFYSPQLKIYAANNTINNSIINNGYFTSSSINTFDNCTFTNYASFDQSSINTIENSAFSGSSIYFHTAAGTVTIENCTFSGNVNFYGTSQSTIRNSTFTGTYTRFYDVSNMTFEKPYSSVANIYIYGANDKPEIRGYVNLTNIYDWDSTTQCNRFYPIYVYLEGTADPAESANVTIKKDGTEMISGLTDASGYVNLNITFTNDTGKGLYNYTLYMNNAEKGNITFLNDTSPDGIILYFDITPPTVTITAPTNTTYAKSVDFNVTLNEAGDWCGFELDSGSNITMTKYNTTYFNYTNSSVSAGSHYVKFWCNDTAGNMNFSATRYFTISGVDISVHEDHDSTDKTWQISNLPLNFQYYCYGGSDSSCDSSLAYDSDGTADNFTIENLGYTIDILAYAVDDYNASTYLICSSTDASDGDDASCVSPPSTGENGADNIQIYNGSSWFNLSSKLHDGTSYGLAIACDVPADTNITGMDFQVRAPTGVSGTYSATISIVAYSDVAGCAAGSYFTP